MKIRNKMKDNPVLDKSFDFALRIVKLYRYLVDDKKEFVLSRELLVSGTHIGKHIKEANNGESRQVFIHEMAVARRKVSETEYWLELLQAADLLSEKQFRSVVADLSEVSKLLTAILKTSKDNA